MKYRRVRNGVHYIFDPVLMDRTNGAHLQGLAKGTEVIVGQPAGCPKNNTAGHCYIYGLDKRFIGMVCTNSLIPVKEWLRRTCGQDEPATT